MGGIFGKSLEEGSREGSTVCRRIQSEWDQTDAIQRTHLRFSQARWNRISSSFNHTTWTNPRKKTEKRASIVNIRICSPLHLWEGVDTERPRETILGWRFCRFARAFRRRARRIWLSARGSMESLCPRPWEESNSEARSSSSWIRQKKVKLNANMVLSHLK